MLCCSAAGAPCRPSILRHTVTRVYRTVGHTYGYPKAEILGLRRSRRRDRMHGAILQIQRFWHDDLKANAGFSMSGRRGQYEIEDVRRIETRAVEHAAESGDMTDISTMLLVQLDSIHAALDPTELEDAKVDRQVVRELGLAAMSGRRHDPSNTASDGASFRQPVARRARRS
jgi:hypothetical protein